MALEVSKLTLNASAPTYLMQQADDARSTSADDSSTEVRPCSLTSCSHSDNRSDFEIDSPVVFTSITANQTMLEQSVVKLATDAYFR
eukprot:6273020-Amphidinium_carterae.2